MSHSDVPNPLTRQVLIVGNPFSGTKGNRKHVEEFIQILAQRGMEPVALWEPKERRETFGQPDFENRFRCVIVAGGDGTVRDVLNEQPRVPIAVLPLGNENLFAKEFGYSLDAKRLADAVGHGQSRLVDVGIAGGSAFGVVLSAGFDADVVHRVAHWRAAAKTRLKRVNNFSYVPRTLSALSEYSFPRVELEADGKKYEGYHAFVLNFNRYCMGLSLAPKASGDDGRLDWLLMTRPGRVKVISCMLRLMMRRELPASLAIRGVASNIAIRSAQPVPVEVDGDPFGFTPVDIAIKPAAISVLTL